MYVHLLLVNFPQELVINPTLKDSNYYIYFLIWVKKNMGFVRRSCYLFIVNKITFFSNLVICWLKAIIIRHAM